MITNYVILALCIIVILSYLFDVSFRYSRIPGVVLLIALGIILQLTVKYTGASIPNLEPVLPVLGTLGLILIVMDAALEIKLERNRKTVLIKSVASATIMLVVFSGILALIFIKIFHLPQTTALLNAIPLGIISSAVAISSSVLLERNQREFITFESAISDILGILAFDFILLNQGSLGSGILSFAFKGLITILIAAIMTGILAFLLHKIKYHVSYIIILTSVVMIYVLAKLVHLPGLFLVVIFGLALSNNQVIGHTAVNRFIDFEKFRDDISSFKKILAELTFLVRSFFFIMFGYYTSLSGFADLNNLLFSMSITAGIFLLRWLLLRILNGKHSGKLVWFAPRGLITILLFLSIPETNRTGLISEEVVTLVILLSIFVMMIGNMLPEKQPENLQKNSD
jgi:NhaP-type Na+/H+ or K+/H+ antiporter